MIRPSKLARALQCPGWYLSALGVADESGAAAEEGTAAHEYAEYIFGEYMRPDGTDVTGLNLVGRTASNGVMFTESMRGFVLEYTGYVLKIVQEHGLLMWLQIEQKIACPQVHPETEGTPDAWLYVDRRDTLHVFDLKFGFTWVDPYEHPAMSAYASGVISKLALAPDTVVHIHVCQPRAWHPDGRFRVWTTTAGELRAFVNVLNGAVEAAIRPGAPLRVGPECTYCPVKVGCRAYQAAASAALDVQHVGMPSAPDPEGVGVMLSDIDRAMHTLKGMRTALEEQALTYIRHGRGVPGWERTTGKGRMRWAKPDAEVLALGSIYNKDLQRPPEPVTPAEATRLGIPKEILTLYTETPTTGEKLKPVDLATAKRVFAQ